jgi:hypothetical protein
MGARSMRQILEATTVVAATSRIADLIMLDEENVG